MRQENIEDIYPLSPMQQGMLFHSIYAPESKEYIEQMSCALHGQLNEKAFERAWQEVINRNTILRTAFVWENLAEPLQVVHAHIDLKIEQLDWRHIAESEQESRFEEFLQAERNRGLDLSEAPLMRLSLIQFTDQVHQFVWTHHHILIDGWSLPLLLEEVFAFYESLDKGQPLQRERRRPYRDYIAWLQQQDLFRAEKFWRINLNGFMSPTPIMLERLSEDGLDKKADYDKGQTLVSEGTSNALQSITRQYQLTLNTIMQGVWALLLSRYSNQEDVIFGATVSGRPPELLGSEFMIGLFINTLPIRVKISPEMSLLDWLKRLQQQQSELRQYEYSSLIQIQGWSDVPRDLPLFESILVFENYPVDERFNEQKNSVYISDIESYSRTNYPLTMVVSPGKQIGLETAFDRKRFDPVTIQRILEHFKIVLDQLAMNPEQRLSELEVLTEQEKQKILIEWNETTAVYPADQCIHQVFEAQVEKTPDAIALEYESDQLTYRTLNERANQLAHYVRKLGVKPEVLVGICMDRSIDMVIGMIGVLKAGGAYVPIDPNYPVERIEYMLTDSNVSILLTQHHLIESLPRTSARIIQLDTEWGIIAGEEKDNLANMTAPENLAYVIYTSGSTGLPKGTLLNHRGLINFAREYAEVLECNENGRVLQFASISFDASVGEIFGAILFGGTLVIAEQEKLLSAIDLHQLLVHKEITAVTLPPSMLALLQTEGLPALKTVMSVGESCSREVVERWSKNRLFFNGYGPTEATVGASWSLIQDLPEDRTNIPIGKVLANKQIYIVDRQLQPVPIGVPGELLIAGVGLARGYLNRPDLTAEKFIPNPFNDADGERMYKTGDLARFLPDGSLEFLGRIDFQVKIRGFRIELGEIEQALYQHPAVKSAVVMAREDKPGDKKLVAYYIINNERLEKPNTSELYNFLREKLPDYMVPSFFIELDSFPLTSSGKVDRKALPAPEPGRPELRKKYIAPRTPTEELIAEIWAQALNVEKVGVYDNFFELGGHSLIGVKVQSRIREAFQVELPLRTIFETPTVAELTTVLESAGEKIQAPPIKSISRDQDLRLSFAQQRLWFLDQLEPNNPFYNIPSAVRLKGKLNIDALEKSFAEMIRRHESLRTTFKSVDGKPFLQIAAELPLPLTKQDLRNLTEKERELQVQQLALAEAQRPFNLSEGPSIRATLLQLAEEDQVILFTMHHIISDGWSMSILVNEIAQLYQAFSQAKFSPLAELPIQYADYAHWQREWLQGEVLQTHLSYWKQQLAGIPPVIELPTDRPRPAVQSFNGATLSRMLPKTLSNSIKNLAREEGSTLFMTLIAAFKTLLYRYSGQADICVGTPIANRNHIETENLIGFFVNTLVLRTTLSDDMSFLDLLKQVREVALGAYAHQDLPFETLVEALQPYRDLSHSPIFQVMFVLQNLSKQSIELQDLTLIPLSTDSGNAKFDLTLIAEEENEGIGLSFEYNTDLFDEATIFRMMDHFQMLLSEIVAAPEQPIVWLPLLTDAEECLILKEWNETQAEFPRNLCMHQWFESLAKKNPDAVAVIFKDQKLSYSELNRHSNQLANHLIKLGIRQEDLIGICMERSLEMVISVLGTLKAGAAFIPLDPAYPEERLSYMITDASISVLLTQQELAEHLNSHQAQMISVDLEWEKIAQENADNLNLTINPSQLAYVIYTSGSTGKPKGTMLQHRGWCNLGRAQQKAFGVSEGSRILQFSSLSFDASVWEIVMALTSGAALILTDREMLATGQGLLEVMDKEKITTVTLPPSVLAVVPPEKLPELKTIITAGEACTSDLANRWSEGRHFFNAYGPTETTVCASMFRVPDGYQQNPPIGRPISNFKLYILGEQLQPVPIGVSGELCVGGIGLARGYLNRPDLTAEKFIPDHLGDEPGARLYRTGDLVRYLPDGNIEFSGRIDQQVKVRGFRIELGEIEAVLGGHPKVKDVVVIVREDKPGDKRIVAYLISEPEVELTVGELRSYLRERLPEYMVPSAFITLVEFPLTPNGKIDRKALPAPDSSRPELENEYVAPRNETEGKLATICAELLNLEKVGIYDNFFELGGHSLLATQFISRVRTTFDIELPLRSLFEKPTIEGLAEAISEAQLTGPALQQAPAIQRVSREAHRVKRSDLMPENKN